MRFLLLVIIDRTVLSGSSSSPSSDETVVASSIPSKPYQPSSTPPLSLSRTGSLGEMASQAGSSFRRSSSVGSLRRAVVPVTTSPPPSPTFVVESGQRITIEEQEGTYVYGVSSPTPRHAFGHGSDDQADTGHHAPTLESPVTSASLLPHFLARSTSDNHASSVTARSGGMFVRSPGALAYATSVGAKSYISLSGADHHGTGLSYLDMSPLSAMASSARRADLIGDVRATHHPVADLSHLLERCSPLSVRYSISSERALLAQPMVSLPQEVRDWVYSIVSRRTLFEDDEAIENCFQIFRAREAVASEIASCLAKFDSAVADELLESNLRDLPQDISRVCEKYDECQLGDAPKVRLPASTPSRMRSSSSAGGALSAFTPFQDRGGTHSEVSQTLESIAWKSNPALTAVVTLLIAPSPVQSPDRDGDAGKTHAYATSILHLYTRSPAEFENLRALWFVHSRDYRRHFRAKLISNNEIYSWFQWTDFPTADKLLNHRSLYLSSMHPDTSRNIFYESEYYFPESLAIQFLFNKDVEVIAKDFLMYPHKVYFGIGPKVRALLEALDENLAQLMHSYLAHSLGIEDASEYHVTTRGQVEAGAFVDMVYNSPLMFVSSRMPQRDLDPEPIVRDSSDPLSSLYSKISLSDTRILWQHLRVYWPHRSEHFGMDCLTLKLIMATGSEGALSEGMERTMKASYDFCFSKSRYVDVTILPMMMYFISSSSNVKLSYGVPIMLTDMLGNLANGKEIDRAARLKGALGVANQQLGILLAENPVHPPVPTWYSEHVNERITLASLFLESYPGPRDLKSKELNALIRRRIDCSAGGRDPEWDTFTESEIFKNYDSAEPVVKTSIETLRWFYEVFGPSHPRKVTSVIILDVFDAELFSILYEPVDRENLDRWNRFKGMNPLYENRSSLPPAVKEIINVVEWYFEGYQDGFWLDYAYPWFFITNIYGEKYNQVMIGGRNVAAATELVEDITIILNEVVGVHKASLEKGFDDNPRLAEFGEEAREMAAESFLGGSGGDYPQYYPFRPIPVQSDAEGNLKLIIQSVLVAHNLLGRIKGELDTLIEVARLAVSSVSTISPENDSASSSPASTPSEGR